MTKNEIFDQCKLQVNGDPVTAHLLMAIIEQESAFEWDASRLEQGYYRRYTMPQSLATTSEILLACSYGLMQAMGQSLREMEYFEFYKIYHNARHTQQLTDPLSQLCICQGVDAFMVRPAWQIEWGTKWFRRKLKSVGNDIEKALLRWNGGGNPKYPSEVLGRVDRLKKSYPG